MRVIDQRSFVPFDWDAMEDCHRRHLPHLEQPGAIYFVTFRLADSVPQKLLRRWLGERETWLTAHSEPWSETEQCEYRRLFTVRMERWLDSGYGECVLREERCRNEIAERLSFRNGEDYHLGDWVVMPNHVHVLLQPLHSMRLHEMLKPIKGVSSRNINRMLGRAGTLWMEESFNHIVRSLEQLKKFQRYIRENPMKAGLAKDAFSYEQRWEIA